MHLFAIAILVQVGWITTTTTSAPLWSWECKSGNCTRVAPSPTPNATLWPTIETCRLVCGPFGGLWPAPTGKTLLATKLVLFSASQVHFRVNIDSAILSIALDNLERLMKRHDSNCPNAKFRVMFRVTAADDHPILTWKTDESYNLTVDTHPENATIIATIVANTVFGARHALETLTQLIEPYPNYAENATCLSIPHSVQIVDAPSYPHRGLLLDTSRNFLTIKAMKRHVVAMAASKMNVLHWHATDSHSFPLEIGSLPNMTEYGAYSRAQIYSVEATRAFVRFSRLRGVRVIIEVDAPAHAAFGWQWGAGANLGDLAVCVNRQPWRQYCVQPPCGQLNPVNSNVYAILEDLYTSLYADYLPQGEVFHMGGDEVFIPCWNATPEIVEYMNSSRSMYDFMQLWAEFQTKAVAALDIAVGHAETKVIVWTSHLTTLDWIEDFLPKERYVIQTWVEKQDPLPVNLTNLGYQIIVSTKNAWYLDHGFRGNTRYYSWSTVYDNQMPDCKEGVLGGEVCMWGEMVDDEGVEGRTWPRAAAAAERLWSNLKSGSRAAQARFFRHRERLVERGVAAEAVAPKWCYQNERSCI